MSKSVREQRRMTEGQHGSDSAMRQQDSEVKITARGRQD